MTEKASNEVEEQKKSTIKLRLNIGQIKNKIGKVDNFSPSPPLEIKLPKKKEEPSSSMFNSIPINSKKPKTNESPIIKNLTNVPSASIHQPISQRAPINTSSAISQYLAEREEERAYKTTIQESLLKYTRQISHPSNWDFPISSTIQNTIDAVIPFWILCSNLSNSKNNFIKTQNISIPITKDDLLKRFDEIENTFNSYVQTQLEKPISSELSLLEQRLCLEEERYLYAKLKKEYNIHVNEQIQKSRNEDSSRTS